MSKQCADCGISKAMVEFSGKRNSCKSCVCRYVKSHYKKNGRSYQRAKSSLKNDSRCEVCGREDYLEFDHLERKGKGVTIGRCQSTRMILEEAKKCRYLCMWCHRIETHRYNKEVQREKLFDCLSQPDEDGLPCGGVLCNGETVTVSSFYKRKGGRSHTTCIGCMYYSSYLKRTAVSDHVNHRKRQKGECERCLRKVVEGNEMCFDYDHIDPKTKKCNVSDFCRFTGTKLKDVDIEIEKCQLLCCMCHFDRTTSVKSYQKKIKRH